MQFIYAIFPTSLFWLRKNLHFFDSNFVLMIRSFVNKHLIDRTRFGFLILLVCESFLTLSEYQRCTHKEWCAYRMGNRTEIESQN